MLDRLRRGLLFLAAFVLPQEFLNLSISGFAALTPNKVVNVLLVGYAALAWALRGTQPPRNAKNAWIIFFFASVGVSFVGSFVQGVELRPLVGVGVTWVSLLLFYLVMAMVIDSVRDLDSVFKGLALGCIVVVVSAALGLGNAAETRYGTRAGGAGGNPNMLAFNLCLVIPMCMAMFMSTRKSLARMFYLVGIGVSVAGIVVSLSRSGFLAIAAMGSLWMARNRRVQYILPMFLAVVIMLLLVPEGWIERIGTISLDPTDQSAKSRLDALPAIFDAFLSSPIVGIGLIQFITFSLEHGYSHANVIHNAFLEVLAEQGLLGFVPFIVIHMIVWLELGRSYRAARRLRMHRDPELIALGLRAGLLQIAFLGAIVMAMFAPSQAHKGLWLMFALGTAVWTQTRRRVQTVLAEAGEQHGIGDRVEPHASAPRGLAPGSVRA